MLLVKPQYEAGRARLGKGGIVRDPAVHDAVLREVVAALDAHGLGVGGLAASPLRGADGNVEFFVRARARAPPSSPPRSTRVVGDARGRQARAGHVEPRGRRRDDRSELRARTVDPRRRAAYLGARRRGVVRLRPASRSACPKRKHAPSGCPISASRPTSSSTGSISSMSLGGDGTMLHAVDLVYPAPVPILGVNVGQLGYLTERRARGARGFACPGCSSGDFEVSERMVLEVEVTADGPAAGTWFALNEAVLEKQRSGHLIRLDVSINGSAFTTYAADGVIVATPTGTTAYSFSVRGPIASPALRCLVLTPVSPHMLFDRSLVLADREELGFVVCGERGNVVLTVDGRELGELCCGRRGHDAAPQPSRCGWPACGRATSTRS